MSVLPPEFVHVVKDALEHLYDPAYLTAHSLARLLLPPTLPPGVSPAQALRQVLLDAVEALDPGPKLSVTARQRRAYRVLELRYVEALSFRDVMAELALSQTQYHRDQRHALEAIATLLWEHAQARGQDESAAHPVGPTAPAEYPEVDAAAHRSEGPIALGEVVQGVVELLRPVATERRVVLIDSLPARPTLVRGSRTTIRQLVITLAGYLLAAAAGGELAISSRESEGPEALRLTYAGRVCAGALRTPEAQERLALAGQLVRSLRGVCQVQVEPDMVVASVTLLVRRRSLLVIDDSADLVQLVARFLADQDYTVLSAGTVQEGLGLARNDPPDVVLLDIMIPEQDGWDALQALKHDPVTQDVPVIVCTVLAEAELALALGAAEFIRKPLTRPALLAALDRWARPAPRSPEGNPGPSEPS